MHSKQLYLLSFSLSFLAQGVADDFSNKEAYEQVRFEEYGDDQKINFLGNSRSFSQLPQSTASQSASKTQECLSPYHRMHASIRHNESKGIGYKEGYTTLEAFGIYDGYSKYFMPFIDIRGHVFNNGKLAGNVGIGERTLFPSINHIFGSYLYYDVRRIGRGLTVNQLSPGLELVGKRMEYRVNGYFPVGKDKSRKYAHKYEFDQFRGNRILLKSRAKQYRAMRGFDSEVGVHLTQSTKYDLYAAAGPYYFQAPHANSWGGRTRLLGRYKEYVSLEVAYSYDHLFRSVVEGSVAVTLPFGRKLKRTGKGCPQSNDLLLSRAAFAPSRFEIPVVKKITKRSHERAINPATGRPWTVWFVNNTSSSAGTFESPFPTLLQAQNASSPNDMIYVFAGDGTTKGMNQGITLKDGQSFFGAGIEQQFSSTRGTMTIPAMSTHMPAITRGAGFVVTIGNGNTVSGFNFTATAQGITSPSSGINGATIANNNITNNIAITSGIQVTGFGTVNIYNNRIISPNGVNAGSAISLTAIGKTMKGVINNNFASGAFIESIDLLAPAINPGVYDFEISKNTINGYRSAGIFPFVSKNSDIRIINNSLQTDQPFGGAIYCSDASTGTSGKLFIANNNTLTTITPNPAGQPGITIVLGNASNSHINATVINNSVKAHNVGSILTTTFQSVNSGNLCLTLNNNNIEGTMLFITSSPGVINVDSMKGNVVGFVSTTGTGTVNLVPKGTCAN